jgi:hypothetical protein
MDADLLNDLQIFCKDAYEASLTGEIASHTLLKKYVATLNSIFRKSGSGQSVADMVKEWLAGDRGKFFTKDVYIDLGFTTRTDKNAVNMALIREMEKGNLVKCGDKRGCWRPTVTTMEPINWRDANPNASIHLVWPLELDQYFDLYPTNIVIIAGEKNAGKTAFCLNFAYLNHADCPMPIHYFSSEMMEQELAVRVCKFPEQEPFDRVHFWRLEYETVVDMIQPNCINIIDFLEVTDEFWLVGHKIRKIWEKVENGIAIICIQKDPDAKLGRGKAFSTEKARVYLTMTKKQLLTLEEVKNWKNDVRNPGLVIPYRFRKDGIIERKQTLQPLPKPPPRAVAEGEAGVHSSQTTA